MRLLDIARSAYVKSPLRFRQAVAPLISMVPTALKYGPSYRTWRDDIARSHGDVDFTVARVEANLRRILKTAHDGSSFHRDRLVQAFGSDFDLESARPEDIARLPVLTKACLREAGDAALTRPSESLVRNVTSGSNGEQPFAFYVDRDRSVREFAFVNDVWSRAGYEDGQTRCVLKGFRLKGAPEHLYEWEAALRELRLSVFPMTQEDVALYLDLIDQRQIRFLHGYPSAIEVFCRHMLRLDRKLKLPIIGVLPISEPLYDHQRRLIRAALGNVAFAPFYGLSEKALFAGELKGENDIYEVEPLYGYAELLDDQGQPVTKPGTTGRLVGTGFISSGMPFIRYDTQDRATLVRAGTRENGWRMRICNITPRRKPSFFIGKTGERIVATNFPPQDPAFFEGMAEFQFYQDAPGHCVLKYIPTPAGTPADAERIRQALEVKAEGMIRFDLMKVDTIAVGEKGKRSFIDQRLDLAVY